MNKKINKSFRVHRERNKRRHTHSLSCCPPPQSLSLVWCSSSMHLLSVFAITHNGKERERGIAINTHTQPEPKQQQQHFTWLSVDTMRSGIHACARDQSHLTNDYAQKSGTRRRRERCPRSAHIRGFIYTCICLMFIVQMNRNRELDARMNVNALCRFFCVCIPVALLLIVCVFVVYFHSFELFVQMDFTRAKDVQHTRTHMWT